MNKAEIYQRAAELLEEQGFDARLYPDYSGRGMFGKTTPGIVSGAPLAAIGWAVTVAYCDLQDLANPADAYDYLPQRSDQLGLSMIYY